MLSEMMQTQKDKYCMALFLWSTQDGQILRDGKENRGTRAGRRGRGGSGAMGMQAFGHAGPVLETTVTIVAHYRSNCH